MLSAVVFVIAGQTLSAPTACPGMTTPEVNACLGDELTRAEGQWHRYEAAATGRIAHDHASDVADTKRVTTAFRQAEVAWITYRKAECGAVFDDWSAGTIGTSMEIPCETRLTIFHVHAIWRDWLTYMDSTPPILPEPDIEEGLGGHRRRDVAR